VLTATILSGFIFTFMTIGMIINFENVYKVSKKSRTIVKYFIIQFYKNGIIFINYQKSKFFIMITIASICRVIFNILECFNVARKFRIESAESGGSGW